MQPDLLALGPDGQRIIVEICCNNMDYDAANIMAETGLPQADLVVAVAPDKQTVRGLQKALQKAAGDSDRNWLAKVLVLEAIQCLSDQFDWAGALAKK